MSQSRTYVIAISLLALLVSAAAASEPDAVRVMGQATVKGPSFTLGDIAVISVADPSLKSLIARMRIGVSPMPGNWRELTKATIRDQLARTGILNPSISIVCPPVVRIYRESQSIGQTFIETRLRNYIIDNAPWTREEIEITGVSRVGNIILPSGELEIVIRPRGSSLYIGRSPFTVEMLVDGQSARQIIMQVNISVYREAVIATAPVPAHEVIGPDDVELRRVDISTARGKTFSSIDKVIGMAATTYLQPGRIVTRGAIRQPILVRRGKSVELVAKAGGFVIRTVGIAQQDGRRGDVIRVLNTGSKKIIAAIVTGHQKATVLF